MHKGTLLRWSLLALPVLFLSGASPKALQAHPISGGLTVGTRTFEKRLDFEPDVAIGVRIGTELTEHASVYLEYLHTEPSRKTTGSSASIRAYRIFTRASFTSWVLKPYVQLGLGGVLFDFRDGYDSAAGTLTVGAGLSADLSSRFALMAEVSTDFYRYREVTYGETGQELSSTARSTDNIATFCGGVQVSF